MVAHEKIRILLADDHQMVRECVRGLLAQQADFEVVAEASDGQMAVELAQRVHPDVVVMDVNMPRVNGIEATQRIKSQWPDVEVIGLTMNENEQIRRAMRRAGSSAYVRKDEASENLVSAIRQYGRHGR